MNLSKRALMLFSFLSLMVYAGCEDSDDSDSAVTTIDTPLTYSFTGSDGNSSASYSGQVVRNLLINDLKTQMGTDAGKGNPGTLLSMMANDHAPRAILSANGKSTVQTKYHDISTSHLNDRLDVVSAYTIPGYNTDAKTMITGMVAEAVSAGITRASGIRLDQMVQKTLWGAVSYWQATSKYMSKIPTDDNTLNVEGKNYTAMEHHWDESFGYFGAAVDYATGYTDDSDRKNDSYYDSNSDGKIDFKSEYNMGWSVTAAKRDVCSACDENLDFTKTIFDAYLKGRTLITNKAPLAEILVQRDLIMETWEKVVAAVSIHYVNEVIADLEVLVAAEALSIFATPTSEAAKNYENHWSEMRGYANGLLYNDFKKISDANLNRTLIVMGTAPKYSSSTAPGEFVKYHGQLMGEVRAIFKATYGFSDANMAGW